MCNHPPDAQSRGSMCSQCWLAYVRASYDSQEEVKLVRKSIRSIANMILSLLDYGLSMLTAVAETVTGAAVMTSTFGTMSGMIIASMGAAATSILATLGPFLLVGAVVAAVGAGIVLAVMHWGEISTWLQTTWSAVISWFNSALQTVRTAVQSVINWFE